MRRFSRASQSAVSCSSSAISWAVKKCFAKSLWRAASAIHVSFSRLLRRACLNPFYNIPVELCAVGLQFGIVGIGGIGLPGFVLAAQGFVELARGREHDRFILLGLDNQGGQRNAWGQLQ